MKRFAGGIALLFLAACGESAPPSPPAQPKPDPPEAPKPSPVPAAKGPVDKKGRSKSLELFKKYMAIMDENGEISESIKEDIEKKKFEPAIKPKLLKLRKNAETAKELHYRKDADEDMALSTDFDLFLMKLKKLEQATWTEENSQGLLENLNGRCVTCHDTFQ
ncbi:MAG TPA: hypothetical protein VJB14_17330 [Planctomycetota bacterium]|nr:hypothetical protein [Planctomycetota bacterium]